MFDRRALLQHTAAAAAAIGLPHLALASSNGTRAEAQAMVSRAVEHVRKAGADKAFKDFSEDKAAWVDRDLYVFAFDTKGNTLAHGANVKLIGRNLIELKDQNGKAFVAEFMTATAGGKGEAWVDYDWANPTTKKVEGKASFVKRIPGMDLLVGVGVYR
jgi:cytochrome c